MNNIVKEDIQSIIDYDKIDWTVFADKTVLITGANGMLPSYMALTLLMLNRLRNMNITVLLLVRNADKSKAIFGDLLDMPTTKLIVQDVCRPVEYSGPIHYIVHAASKASPKYYGTDPVGTACANVIGTNNLLELAKDKKVSGFLYFSTGGVYGNLERDDIVITEDMTGKVHPLHVRSCYFESKRMGENLCADYAYQYKVPAKVVRIFHTLGPGIDINDNRAFSDFCKCILNNQNIVLKSDGTARRTFLYVTDAIKAYFLILLNGVAGEAYNVGSHTQEVDMRTLAEELVKSYPDKKLSVVFDVDTTSVTYTKMRNAVDRAIPSTYKINKLGWTEEIPYIESFKRTIDALSENNN